jgi:hypothetical protein
MGMTALRIVQEAARRLTIMQPSTIEFADPTSQDTDYDALLLLSCLNSCVQQNVVNNTFKRTVKLSSFFGDPVLKITSANDDGYHDFALAVSDVSPLFERLASGGIMMKFSNMNEAYEFRQIPIDEGLQLMKSMLDEGGAVDEDGNTVHEELRQISRNFPSEVKTNEVRGKNRQSGYMVVGDFFGGMAMGKNPTIYFCNNMIKIDDDPEGDYSLGNLTVQFAYYERVVAATTNAAVFVGIPDELLILGTVVNFKNYHALDYTLDMAQYNAFIEGMKRNDEQNMAVQMGKRYYYNDTERIS